MKRKSLPQRLAAEAMENDDGMLALMVLRLMQTDRADVAESSIDHGQIIAHLAGQMRDGADRRARGAPD